MLYNENPTHHSEGLPLLTAAGERLSTALKISTALNKYRKEEPTLTACIVDISENVTRSFYSFNPLNIPAYKTEDLIQRYYILALLLSC